MKHTSRAGTFIGTFFSESAEPSHGGLTLDVRRLHIVNPMYCTSTVAILTHLTRVICTNPYRLTKTRLLVALLAPVYGALETATAKMVVEMTIVMMIHSNESKKR